MQDGRPCAHCGAPITSGSRKRLYCSERCKYAAAWQRRCSRGERRFPTETVACKRCGTAFERKRNGRTPAEYCSTACWPNSKGYRLTVTHHGPCIECGASMRLDRAKYCSPRCRAEAGKRRQREHHETKVAVQITQPCAECGVMFSGRAQRRYCSDGCARRNGRRRHKKLRSKRIRDAATREPIDLPTLAVRDGWCCHICKRKVSRKNVEHRPLGPAR